MKRLLSIILLLCLLPVLEAAWPKSYVRVYWNRKVAEFYCTHIVGSTYYLVSTTGVQMCAEGKDLQNILIYPRTVGEIQPSR